MFLINYAIVVFFIPHFLVSYRRTLTNHRKQLYIKMLEGFNKKHPFITDF